MEIYYSVQYKPHDYDEWQTVWFDDHDKAAKFAAEKKYTDTPVEHSVQDPWKIKCIKRAVNVWGIARKLTNLRREDLQGTVKGYKWFYAGSDTRYSGYKDWTTTDELFACPGRYELDCVPNADCYTPDQQPMQFWLTLESALLRDTALSFVPDRRLVEVVAYGDTKIMTTEGDSRYTNKLQAVREVSAQEIQAVMCDVLDRQRKKAAKQRQNSGKDNDGEHNTGNGNCGNYNAGRGNEGWYNSGDWNKTNYSNGCFNTSEPKIYMFGSPTNWTYSDWKKTKAYEILQYCPTKGEIATRDKTEPLILPCEQRNPVAPMCWHWETAQQWWDELSPSDKMMIIALPNFDSQIFLETTGIDVGTFQPTAEPDDDIPPIRRYRRAKGITQKQLAAEAGVFWTQIQKFENGERDISNASARIVLAIADALGVDPHVLID